MYIEETDFVYIYRGLKNSVDQLRNSEILITGGTGFIGKWILSFLFFLNNTHHFNIKISVISRNPGKFQEQYPEIETNSFLTWLKGDIRDFTVPAKYYDYFIHAATEADAELNIKEPLFMSDVIVNGTKRLLDYAILCKPRKILFLSSGAVYGKQPDSISGFVEDDSFAVNQLEIGASYGESKKFAEFLCVNYARRYNLSVSIARCFAFVGPYLPLTKHFAIGNFINDGLSNRDIIVRGNGLPLRSYMYASDMVIWLLSILLQGNNCEAYNVGSDKALSIGNLALKVSSFFANHNVKILNQVKEMDRNQNYVPNVDKAKDQFKFFEEIDLNEGIKRTIKFYKKYGKD